MHPGTLLILLTLVVLSSPVIAEEAQCDWEADACIKYMVESFEKKGWIGIELDYSEGESPEITRVLGDSPAEQAGLVPGDELLALDGVPYATATEDQLREARKVMVPGREVRLTIRRGGEELDVPLTLGSIPHAVLAQWIGSHLVEQHKHQYETAEADEESGEGDTG